MGEWCSGHSCRNETLALDSVALYRRIGIETIPNETTPFHIDRGMATQFTSWFRGWLLFVGRRLSALSNQRLRADIAALQSKYRASEPREDEEQQERQVAAVHA